MPNWPTLTIKGPDPWRVEAARDYQQFHAKYEPWRPSHVQELARLPNARRWPPGAKRCSATRASAPERGAAEGL